MKKRATITALLIGALAFVALAYAAVYPIGAGAATAPASVNNAIISPARLPTLVRSVAGDATLRADASSAIATGKGGQVCIAVVRDGRSIVNISGNQPLIPASSLKLLTATAALSLYGPDARFTTSVKAAATSNGVVNGPLYLIGGGDPLLFTADYDKVLNRTPDPHTSLEGLADQVAARGIKVVNGSVIGDDSRFDQTRYLGSWDPGYAAQGQIGPTGGLQVNQGFERFVGGRVPAANPTLQAVAIFTELLKQRGITVSGEPASGLTPGTAQDVTDIQSPTVAKIIDEMLTQSDNTAAEMMLRNIGVKASGAGTFAAGIAAVKKAATAAGISMDGVTMVDGSGLDRSDRATCATLLTALTHDGPQGTIANGLPRAGQTGTLTARMNNTSAVGRVQAKTGTLSGVSALAGWVTPFSGDPFTFAIVNNGVTSDQGRVFEDSLAETFASLPA